MLDALLVSVALTAVPSTQHLSAGSTPVAAANRWQDSGDPRAWEGVPEWVRDVGHCIRKHESINQGHYRARYPDRSVSSAAGAYQFIFTTWSGNARWVKGAKSYADGPASSAPAWVQDKVFVHVVEQGGLRHWKGTDCPGTG